MFVYNSCLAMFISVNFLATGLGISHGWSAIRRRRAAAFYGHYTGQPVLVGITVKNELKNELYCSIQ